MYPVLICLKAATSFIPTIYMPDFVIKLLFYLWFFGVLLKIIKSAVTFVFVDDMYLLR